MVTSRVLLVACVP